MFRVHCWLWFLMSIVKNWNVWRTISVGFQCRESQSPNSTLDKTHRGLTTDTIVSNSYHVFYYIYHPSTNLFIINLSWPHFNLSRINDFLFSIMETTVRFFSRKIIQIIFHISTALFLNDQLSIFTNVSAYKIEAWGQGKV